jgi:hypothetical protein
MTEFDIEDAVMGILVNSGLYGTLNQDGTFDKKNAYLAGEPYKLGTRSVINNEDTVIEVLSLDDEQFQNAEVSVRTYVDDLEGSPIKVPNIMRLQQISQKFEELFQTRGSSYALTTSKFRTRVSSIKRERREQLNQHCVNCIFNFVIINVKQEET